MKKVPLFRYGKYAGLVSPRFYLGIQPKIRIVWEKMGITSLIPSEVKIIRFR